jgi:hypothetical protein
MLATRFLTRIAFLDRIESPTSHILTHIQDGDTILKVPTTALRTILTVPKSISKAIGSITVHGLLAADLALDISSDRAPWRAVLPTANDFKGSIPLLWDPALHVLLPEASLSLLQNQQRKLSSDWTAVSKAFPSLSYDIYIYNWLLVNTRTFYFTSPKMKLAKPVNRDDCMALNPFADYFNHADVATADASFGPQGYAITASQDIRKGEEIYLSYGKHSNDFLLAEYGFVMKANKWDEVPLDDFVLPLFDEGQKKKLNEMAFLGNYVLDGEGVCYRTQMALRLLCMPLSQWQRLTSMGLEDSDKYQDAVDEILLKVLKSITQSVDGKLESIKALDRSCGLASHREMLSTRWAQIRLLLSTAIRRIESQ